MWRMKKLKIFPPFARIKEGWMEEKSKKKQFRVEGLSKEKQEERSLEEASAFSLFSVL